MSPPASRPLLALTRRPLPAGIGSGVFRGTVIGTAPLRVQAESGVDVEATALFGYTPANGHVVLAIKAADEWFVSRIS